ncbi:MAG TPA: glycosyltransferase, partial [Edaphobacter sp.]|nr:glycosyltransferase [Edaphobacter sp.]
MNPVNSAPGNSVAIVITEVVAMGGAERSCLGLARWLYEHGIDNHILTYVDSVGLERFTSHPLKVIQLKPRMDARHKIGALRAYFNMRGAAPKPIMSGYQPALHAALAGLKGFHCLMHDTPSLFGDAAAPKPLKKRIGRVASNLAISRGLKSGGRTIVTSEYLKAETRRVFGVEAEIARMGGMSQGIAFRPRPVAGKLRMLSVSRVEANKRIDWIVRSLARLEQASIPLSTKVDWRLDVAGKGSELGPMRDLTAQLGLAGRIEFHGFVSDEDLEHLYGTADLFLMPAVQGYGIPAIESLSRGIPVLLHRESGVSDILLETAWATVMEGGEDALAPAMAL